VPVAGDTTKLPFATGLTPLEKRLAKAQCFIASHLPGSQSLRQVMGHSQFGARVVYGDCIFFTISPNELHSALVLRLSRYRMNDPYIRHGGAWTQRLAGKNYPELHAKRRKSDDAEDFVEIELPEYDFRRAATARDPLAVVAGLRVEIYLRLAIVLGVRMCPLCPRCNNMPGGCQDKFGSNMRPLGGSFGGMMAFGGAGEHQLKGTPHLHAEGHVVCAYQFDTLQDIAAKIRSGLFSREDLKQYHDWLHCEDVTDAEVYQSFLPRVEQEWENRFASAEHDSLSVLPPYIVDEAKVNTKSHIGAATDLNALQHYEEEGAKFKAEYFRDVQFVFSRVQHHIHKRTKKGYVPLRSCERKVGVKKTACKADFPKDHLCVSKSLLLCRGLAKRFG
jgi:hypothetical protein